MPKYQLLIRGENFLIQAEGKIEKFGFYTSRWVEATSPTEGEKSVIELIKQDSSLKGVILNPERDPPVLYVEEINEIESFAGVDPPGSGYSFFAEKE